jgi:transposase
MPILADTIDGVIGVDTHRDTLAAAAVSPVGGVLAQTATRADATGYQQLLEFAGTQIPSDPARRCWAIEGAGSYGAGLTAFLHTHGERVVEVARPKRPARRTGAKTDAIDAIRAARETLGHQHQTLPRRRGDREALRVLLTTRRHATSSRVAAVNQLKALIVGAPEELRAELRGVATKAQIDRCVGLRDRPARPLEHRMTVRALRTTARRIQALQAEIDELTAALDTLVASIAPWLVELPGVGPITGAQILVSWSYAGRLRSEAAFAALAGTNPDPRLVGTGHPPPVEPIRGPPTQRRPPHHRAHPAPLRSRDPRLRRPPHHPRQDPPRRQAVPQAEHRPPAVQAPRALRPTRHGDHQSRLTTHSSLSAQSPNSQASSMGDGDQDDENEDQ